MKEFKDTIVIAMGGSLLIPEGPDVQFLKHLKKMMADLIANDYQVALVIGGGKVCRYYQAAAKEFSHVGDIDLDWIGIKTIHLNCELVWRAFSDLDIHEKVVLKPQDIHGIQESLIIVGAWEPGCSSDTDAVEMAHQINASQIINFSSTTHVYSEDPRKNPNATRFESLTWDEYRSLIPKEWIPGLSAPFDPVASRFAQKQGIRVAILGSSIENLKNYLNNKSFEGTVIGG